MKAQLLFLLLLCPLCGICQSKITLWSDAKFYEYPDVHSKVLTILPKDSSFTIYEHIAIPSEYDHYFKISYYNIVGWVYQIDVIYDKYYYFAISNNLKNPENDLNNEVLLKKNKPVVKEYRDKAVMLEAKKQYREALAELTKAIKIADKTDYNEILNQMFRIVRENPRLAVGTDEIKNYDVRARQFLKELEIEKAVLEYEKAIYLAPYIAILYKNSALIYGQLKKFTEAIAYMKIYLQADPDVPDSKTAKDWISKWESMILKEK